MKRFGPRLAMIATLLGTLLLSSFLVTVPAKAASITYFYATRSGLMKVGVSGGKVVSAHTLVPSSSPNLQWFTSSSLGTHAAGVKAVYDSSSHLYKQALFVWDATAKRVHVLTSIKAGQVVSPSLYNSGKSVAYLYRTAGGTSWSVRTMTVGGQSKTTRYTAPSTLTLTSLAARADGRVLYFGAIDRSSGTAMAAVYRLRAGASRPVAITHRIQFGNIQALSLSPDGSTLAYGPGTFPPPTQGVLLQAVTAAGRTKAISYHGDPQTISWSKDGTHVFISDQAANGWFTASVATGSVRAMNFTSTGMYIYPIRA